MPTPSQASAILYVDARKFYFFAPGLPMVTSEIPTSVMREFEIISPEGLAQQVKAVLSAQKTTPGALIIIFSDAICFEKIFPVPITGQERPEITEYFETVPFERVLSRVYPHPNGSKAIALNREIFESFRASFEAFGFTVYSAVPAYVLNLLGVSNLDQNTVGQIFKRATEVGQYTMVMTRQPVLNLQQKQEELAKKHTPLILVVFIFFLIVVFGATFFILNQQQQQVRQISTTPTPFATPIPTPTPTPQPVQTVASPSAENSP